MARLDTLSVDVLSIIVERLSVSDKLALSEVCRFFRSPNVEGLWRNCFVKDFGYKGVHSRLLLVRLYPRITWRSTYLRCTDRRIFYWRHIPTVSEYMCYGDKVETTPLLLPPGLPFKDFGLDRTNGTKVYILSCEGRLLLVRYKNSYAPSGGYVADGVEDLLPFNITCTDMAVVSGIAIAVDTKGNWWGHNGSKAAILCSDRQIRPNTLTTDGHQTFLALSTCGRHVYRYECGRPGPERALTEVQEYASKELSITSILGLEHGRFVPSITQYRLGIGPPGNFICLVLVDNIMYYLYFGKGSSTDSQTLQGYFRCTEPCRTVLMFQENVVYLLFGQHNYTQLRIRSRPDDTEGSVLVTHHTSPGLPETALMEPKTLQEYRSVYQSSAQGDLYLKCGHKLGRHYGYEHAYIFKTARVDLPPMCHFSTNQDDGAAVCLRSCDRLAAA